MQRFILLLVTAEVCAQGFRAQELSASDAALVMRIDSSPVLGRSEEQRPLPAAVKGWTPGAVSGLDRHPASR